MRDYTITIENIDITPKELGLLSGPLNVILDLSAFENVDVAQHLIFWGSFLCTKIVYSEQSPPYEKYSELSDPYNITIYENEPLPVVSQIYTKKGIHNIAVKTILKNGTLNVYPVRFTLATLSPVEIFGDVYVAGIKKMDYDHENILIQYQGSSNHLYTSKLFDK